MPTSLGHHFILVNRRTGTQPLRKTVEMPLRLSGDIGGRGTPTLFFLYHGIHSLMFGGYPPTAIPRIPQSYRTLYTRVLLQYIDVAHGREPRPQWSALPPLRNGSYLGLEGM